VWIALLGAASARAGDAPPPLALSIDPPATGPLGLALVSGRVSANPAPVDLMLAIDTSHSTAARGAPPRGWRYWLARLFARREPAPPSALSDEIARAHAALAQLDARTDRAGVVALAGDLDPRTLDARVAAPLGELAAARAALDALLARGSSGTTNLIDAVELARAELQTNARGGARRALLLLTDGVDVHPLHPDPEEAGALLQGAVARAAAGGIEVEVASLSEAAARPGTLGAVSGDAELAELGVRNARSGAEATAARISGERFAALVQLAPGSNALEIRVRTRAGEEIRGALEVSWNPARQDARSDPELLRAQNALLAAHLRALRARRGPTRSLQIEALASTH
jgi:hypothetical protein